MAVATEISVGAGSLLECRAAVDLHVHTLDHSVFQCVSTAEWVLFSHTHLTANHKYFLLLIFKFLEKVPANSHCSETASHLKLLNKIIEMHLLVWLLWCCWYLIYHEIDICSKLMFTMLYKWRQLSDSILLTFTLPVIPEDPRTGWKDFYWLLLLLQNRGTESPRAQGSG